MASSTHGPSGATGDSACRQNKKRPTKKKTGTSTLAGQAAPGDGEILDQAIVPLPSEQAVTFGSEDVAPGTKKITI